MRAPCTTEDPVSDRRPSGVGKSTDTWVRSRRRANSSYDSFKLDYNKSLIHTHYSFTHEPNVPNIRHIRGYWRMDAYIREFSNDYISNGYISSNGYICKSGYL